MISLINYGVRWMTRRTTSSSVHVHGTLWSFEARRSRAIHSTFDQKMTENYKTRRATSAAEVRSVFVEAAVSEGWRSAIDDDELYYNTDPTGFFVGELDGKPISCVSIVKYGGIFAFFGMYIVAKEHRGKGYGLPLFKHGFESIPPTQNCGLDAILDKVPVYEKWGFKSTWISRRIEMNISTCSIILENFTVPDDVIVQPANQVDFNKLSSYDTAAFGAPHHNYLNGLLKGQNTICFSATNAIGDVVGFVAARRTVLEKEGWKIAPLYADNGQVARTLLKQVFNELVKELPQRKIAMMELPLDINPEACAIADELNSTVLFDMSRMFTKGPLNIPKEKIFSHASADLG